MTEKKKNKHIKGSLKKWTATRSLQTFVHYKVLLLWLIFCFIFKLNLKWLVALKWENLPVMTLWAWEKIRLGKRSLVWRSTVAKLYVSVCYQFITLKTTGRKQYHNSIFIQGFHTGNVHSLIQTRAIKPLHSLISVQTLLKKKKKKPFIVPISDPNAENHSVISQR